MDYTGGTSRIFIRAETAANFGREIGLQYVHAHLRYGFDWIRSGRVGIKGGWRVYSSGPGIFLGQLIGHVLGLRTSWEDVVFDPVLPVDADGLTFDFEYDSRPVSYRFHVSGAGYSPRQVRVNGHPLPGGRYTDNPYRAGGLRIAKGVFSDALGPGPNMVDIFV